jgi:hypothetical protein
MTGETETQNCTKPKKGGTQIVIGIIAGILLIFVTCGGELLKLRLDYKLSHNEALLTELGYEPTDFQKSPNYWIGRLTFHIFGIVAILVYITSVGFVKIKSAKVCFILCLIYFLAHAYGNITNLSPEAQVRGVTLGYWVAKTILWFPKYAVELGLLIQGLIGVRKRISNGGHGFLRSLVGKTVIQVKGGKCRICGKKIGESEMAYVEDGELLCTDCERKTAKSQNDQKQ